MVWTVTELDEGTSFSWQARRPGLVMTARHGIEAQPDGGVVATVRLDVEGPLGRVLDALVGRKIDQAVGHEAAGLKRICEEQARPGT